MKRLFLLRHAQTGPAHGGSDFGRALTPQGEKDAKALGQIMQSKSYDPDFIFCSQAKRTQQTLNHIRETLSRGTVDSPQVIYGGSHGDYFHLIQNAQDGMNSLLMVAHNPSIHSLAAILAQDNSRLMMGYAPGTLSVFDCDIENWADLQPGANALIDLIEPPHAA